MGAKILVRTSASEPISKFINPMGIWLHLWSYRNLIRQLTWREVTGRYKGSFIGLGWSFIHPLVMLCVYTFVFSTIFKSRWGILSDEGTSAFAFTLFMGLISFHIFAEVVNAAPNLILANVNFVKKVVFPLEILPVVSFLSALIHSIFSLLILFAGIVISGNFLSWTVLLLPVVWLPLFFTTLGCGFALASLGVFIRDLSASAGIMTTILFFLTPIFYPITAVPESFKIICMLNPLAAFVENARKVVLWGMTPQWQAYLVGLAFSLFVLSLGFAWFMKSKSAFADVV
ncbi:ABC transporter permease [Desulfobacterales bacterium HSG16]|nr:ABC transporter permease [Desulfobacterales bacterium HSG16]